MQSISGYILTLVCKLLDILAGTQAVPADIREANGSVTGRVGHDSDHDDEIDH